MRKFITNPEDYDVIVKAFNRLKATNGNDKSAPKIISANLSAIYNNYMGRPLQFNVEVSKSTGALFYGLCVSPSYKAILEILTGTADAEAIDVKWSKVSEWDISIDRAIFTDRTLNLNGEEMTAMVLHELGHVVFTNTTSRRFYSALRLGTIRADRRIGKMIENSYKFSPTKLLIVPSVINVCMHTTLRHVDIEGQDEEKEADAFVIKCGFGKQLNSSIDKIICRFGNSGIDTPESQQDAAADVAIRDAITVISMLEDRSRTIKSRLEHQHRATTVPALKKAYEFVFDKIYSIKNNNVVVPHGRTTPNVKAYAVATESSELTAFDFEYDTVIENRIHVAISNYAKSARERAEKEILQESFLSKFGVSKLKKIEAVELAQIDIEIDYIENKGDKVYLLDLCYYFKNQIELGIRVIENGGQDTDGSKYKVQNSKGELTRMLSDVDNMIKRIMKLRVKPQQYGLFIKYPEGYEG